MKKKIFVLLLSAFALFSVTSCAGANGADGKDGVNGVDGHDGKDGKDGTSFRTGEGVPSEELGIDGDTYLDVSTFDLYVKSDGKWTKNSNIKGNDGVVPTIEIGENGNWFINGQDSGVKAEGKDGRSIVSIEKTSSENNIDTYTITYSDETTSTFTVVNSTQEEEVFYSIEFDLNKGALPNSVDLSVYDKVSANTTISLPEPFRQGYIFEGWYTGKLINDQRFTNSTLVDRDLSLVAKWIDAYEAEHVKSVKRDTIASWQNRINDLIGYEYLTKEDYDKFITLIGEVNFASDTEEIHIAETLLYDWFSFINVDQDIIDDFLAGVKEYWESIIFEYPRIEEEKYIVDLYNEIVSEAENDVTLIRFEELTILYEDLRNNVDNWIQLNTIDEGHRDDTLNSMTTTFQLLNIMFEGIVISEESSTLYFAPETMESLIEGVRMATSNTQVDEYFGQFEYELDFYINERFYQLYEGEYIDYRATFIKNVATNAYNYFVEAYNNYKETYGFNDGDFPDFENSLQKMKNLAEGMEETNLYYLYNDYVVELLNRLYEIERYYYMNITFNYNIPYDALMLYGGGYETIEIGLNYSIDITSIAIAFEEKGFSLESIVDNNGETYNFYLQDEMYCFDVTEENGFDYLVKTYDLTMVYVLTDADLARKTSIAYLDEAIAQLEQITQEYYGFDLSMYEENINDLYSAAESIVDQKSYEAYEEECTKFMVELNKKAITQQITEKYEKLLTDYPELKEDALFNEYNDKYLAILESIPNLTTMDELNQAWSNFNYLYYEVLSYAQSVYPRN